VAAASVRKRRRDEEPHRAAQAAAAQPIVGWSHDRDPTRARFARASTRPSQRVELPDGGTGASGDLQRPARRGSSSSTCQLASAASAG
jgi:hypothetical protein